MTRLFPHHLIFIVWFGYALEGGAFSDIIENVINVSEVIIDHIIYHCQPSGRVTPGQNL